MSNIPPLIKKLIHGADYWTHRGQTDWQFVGINLLDSDTLIEVVVREGPAKAICYHAVEVDDLLTLGAEAEAAGPKPKR